MQPLECMTAIKQGGIAHGVALSRGDVANAAVMVLVAVPVHEATCPLPCGIEVSEALGRES